VDRRRFIAGGVAFWAAMPGLAVAQAGWILLGSRTVNWASGRDSIMVARARGPLSALSFRARGGEIFMKNVEVSFVSGGRERLPMNTRLHSNLRSGAISLRGPARDIRRVDFRYRRVTPRGATRRTVVELFGRR
jgi:hypothetical protein